MTYLEFFAELLSEMIGIPKEAAEESMREYERHFKNSSFINSEISKEKMEELRNAAKSDPQGFLKWALGGRKEVLSKTKFH